MQNIVLLISVNSGKWKFTEGSRGDYTFDDLDYVVEWAGEHGHLVRGHSPIWDQDLPSWVEAIKSKEVLAAVVKNHVTTHVGRYKGQIYAWVRLFFDICAVANHWF